MNQGITPEHLRNLGNPVPHEHTYKSTGVDMGEWTKVVTFCTGCGKRIVAGGLVDDTKSRAKDTLKSKLAQEAPPDHIEDELDAALAPFMLQPYLDEPSQIQGDLDKLRAAMATLINKKLVEARIDELERAYGDGTIQHWRVIEYQKKRLAELKGDSHE